nr:uncharacterized protein LOC105331351 isoform X3 [Crassostrea gigas]
MAFVVNAARIITILTDCAKYVRLGFLVTSATQSVHTPGMECNVGPNVTVPILTATRLLDAKTRDLEKHRREICKREHHILHRAIDREQQIVEESSPRLL